MQTIDEFACLVREELGIPLADEDLAADLDRLPEWDSLYMLKLVTALERSTGRKLVVGRVLEARSLNAIYEMAVAP
ncbi:acyl carrier protein [Streptomyces sp. SID9727]|uniref:acyl carrier protein n=1 Tax=Streptomyces sp. SID9727 TaxID=2706114 RepID=UPI0013C9649E|nr:acyl carrier protein [Streptomyces sp. SID9727]NEC66341.1 acyl carrier protein [Streptomyces sp. SID9727]